MNSFTGRPMISSMAFDDFGSGMVFGAHYYYDPTVAVGNEIRTLGFARINQYTF